MSDPITLPQLMADWLGTLDPEAENRYRQQLYRDAYERGHDDGYDAGYMCAVAEIKAVQQDLVRTLGNLGETLEKRWTLRGEKRTQATFSQPHPDDYPGRGMVA